MIHRLPAAALLLCATLLTAFPAGAELSPAEEALVDAIASREAAALELLETSVNINSGTLHFDGVRAVGELFAAPFEALGFETRWIDGAPFGRAGHLIAERPGAGPTVLLIGHLDTVFEPSSPFQRYERLPGNEASGPGVTDMKGGNVVMLLALEALDTVGALDDLDLRVVLTGDEEKSGRPLELARAPLIEAARGADYALGFEDGDSNPATAVVARRGSTQWQLKVSGTAAHSSQIFQPEVGAGAILGTAHLLDLFRQRLEAFDDLTFSPGRIVGGTDVTDDPAQSSGTAFGKSNVVAAAAIVTGDLRALSPEQYSDATEAMRAATGEALPGTRAEVEFSPGYPPMAATEGNRALLGRFDEASRDLGHGPVAAVDPRRAGAADISFVASLVPQCLDGIGLMGRGGHTVDEVADLDTLTVQAERAAVLLYRLSRR